MARTISIGAQGFADIREHNDFYVDKTGFISQWWNASDPVTLICRPRRFGKTLNMSMLECFFSLAYAGRSDLFDNLAIWADVKLRAEQGTWPVVSLSFAGAKGATLDDITLRIRERIAQAWRSHTAVLDADALPEHEADLLLGRVTAVSPENAPSSLLRLCEHLRHATGRRAIVLLDEYDTPMQEAWMGGFWDSLTEFVRSLFNNTFKTNPFLERAVLTGVTRISRESIFSDLNNLAVVTTTTDQYETCFGFTEQETFAALDEMGLTGREQVKEWYDGFSFGHATDIYNPWSITNYLKYGKAEPYWANTSSNALASKLVREGDSQIKEDFERLLQGETVSKTLDEQVAFSELANKPGAVWALLLANGYLKVVSRQTIDQGGAYELALTNREVTLSFDTMVRGWFEQSASYYNGFVQALLAGDLDAMNGYMNDVTLDTFSLFDSGTRPAEREPERFYHGFVLGLLVELRGRYIVTSNRESGYGRYDVMLEPLNPERDDAVIIEFKVYNPHREKSLDETVAAAKAQIAEKRYAASLEAHGVPQDRIRAYGFAFKGKHVLIG